MASPSLPRGAGPGVVITGGSRGIGRAVAERFHRDGARLLLVARDEGRLRWTAEAIDPTGETVHRLAVDVGDPASAQRVLEEARRTLGGVRALVNNAGIALPGAFDRRAPEEIDRELAIDLAAPIRLSRAFVPEFRAHGGGHLLHLGSGIADLPMPNLAVYSAAKAGLRSFSVALDAELRPSGIRSTVIEPIFVRTDLGRSRGEGEAPLHRYARRHPWIVLDPARVADAVVGAFRDPRPIVRVPAAWALGRLGLVLTGPLLRRRLAAALDAPEDAVPGPGDAASGGRPANR